MTRVSLYLWVVLGVATVTSAGDQYFDSAQHLLRDYNSQTSNLGHIKELLERSAELMNPEAFSKLGEFYLFGFPLSPDNPTYVNHTSFDFLTPDLKFKRDIPKAIKYFRKAERYGAKDAAFYLSFLLQQGMLVSELENLTPMSSDLFFTQQKLMMSGLKANSKLTEASVVAGHQECRKVSTNLIPTFLSENFTLEFHKAPYFDEDSGCFGNCDSIVPFALQLATDSIQNFNQQGGVRNSDIGPLNEVIKEVEKQEGTKALTLLKAEAAIGNQAAASKLADEYMFGNTEIGIDRDPDAALKYYEQAANEGDVRALENLGILYSQGIGVPMNSSKAFHYLTEAANRGSVSAHNGLGYLYLNGVGVQTDSSKALQHFQFAAAHGHIESQSNLGMLYLNGQLVERDFSKALDYFTAAAQFGHLPAVFNLGIMHLNGYGVKKSCDIAMGLFSAVAKQGVLGQHLQQAYYFIKYEDYEGAYLSFALAGALGYENGQLSAGYMWEQGMVPYTCKFGQEFCAGSYYAMSVLNTADPWAYYRLGDITYYGSKTIPPNLEEAFELYERGSRVPEARYNMGYMYEHGLGVGKDIEAAKGIYSELISDASVGRYSSDVKYPAYFSLAALKAREYFSTGKNWVESLLSS